MSNPFEGINVLIPVHFLETILPGSQKDVFISVPNKIFVMLSFLERSITNAHCRKDTEYGK